MRGGSAARVVAGAFLGLAATATDPAYRAEILKWREEREARLQADGGWLTVAGLFWLKQGANRFGTDPSLEIVLPQGSAPARSGAVVLTGGETTVSLEPGAEARLGGEPLRSEQRMRPDTSGSPDVLEMGALSLHVIERGGRLAVRVKDKNSSARKTFTGLRWYDVKQESCVRARWMPHEPPKALKVPNVLGQVVPMPSPGYAEFTLEGKAVRLAGVLEEEGASELFFIFRDGTSGQETYGSGRFLYADLPKDGTIVLDFNKAHNPPCAFTPYATCPLPPPQNWLPVRVEAGELAYGKPGH